MSNQLYLENWTVVEVRETADRYEIEATYDIAPTDCPKCGLVDAPLYKHGTKTTVFVDAPVHGLQAHIHVKRGRYRCRECGGTFMQPLPDMDEDRRMTNRCRRYIEKQCLLKPNTHVAEDIGINEKVVRQIAREQANTLFHDHSQTIRAPRILGMDELFLADEMRAIFVDMETSWPIELLPNRWAKPVTNFLYNLPYRNHTRIVTMDMWKPYKTAVAAAMPYATVIVDKWHVMRMANDVMEVARRRYQGLLTARDRKALKARRAAFLKRPFQLSAKEQLELDGWLKNTPELRGAYETKEAFMDIWRARKRETAQAALDQWRATIPDHLRGLFRPVVTATTNWEEEILNYFSHGRWTNAATEARNRVIKMTNRLGAGYSFDMIRARALFGKRPGRVKAELAKKGTSHLVMCESCKGLFDPAQPEATVHAGQRGGIIAPPGSMPLCADCKSYNDEMFEKLDRLWRSTPRDPRIKKIISTWKSE